MTVGTLGDYLKSEWYYHKLFEMIREHQEECRYSGNMKVSSRARAFADCWAHICSCDIAYNADSLLQDNCFVASHEDLSYVWSGGQKLSMLMGLDRRDQVDVVKSDRQ